MKNRSNSSTTIGCPSLFVRVWLAGCDLRWQSSAYGCHGSEPRVPGLARWQRLGCFSVSASKHQSGSRGLSSGMLFRRASSETVVPMDVRGSRGRRHADCHSIAPISDVTFDTVWNHQFWTRCLIPLARIEKCLFQVVDDALRKPLQ